MMNSTARNKDEDSGYGIYYSDDEISIEPTVTQFPQNPKGDFITDENGHHGGLFCNKKSKGKCQSDENWARTTDSSYSSSSEDENDQEASKLGRCLFHQRNYKSEGEINALFASLVSFSTSSPEQQDASRSKINRRPRSNSSLTPSARPMPTVSCLPLPSESWSLKGKHEKIKHSRSQESPITLLPSLNSPWRSFASFANFLQSEKNSDEEILMIDGDLASPESDLSPRIVNHESKEGETYQYLKCRSFHVVTTAALPWMTGTSINPTLRACYLNQMNRNAVEAFSLTQNSQAYDSRHSPPWTVSLVIPWLIHEKDRQELYGSKHLFESPSEQENYIRSWLQDSAKLPLEANTQTHGIRIIFYPARYSKELGSIFALGDICNLIPDEDTDCCILEEPEHLNWMRPMDAGIPLWTEKFKFVVGIIHTNYKAYAQAHVSGFISSPFIGSLSSLIVRAHCHRIIKLSSCLQSFATEKEIVCNTHGIRSEFLSKVDINKQRIGGSYNSIYFMGKLLWAKGLDKLLQLQYFYKKVTGDFFKIDIYGSGPDEVEIKRAFCGSQDDMVKASESEDSYVHENIFLREKILRRIDSLMSDLPSLRHDWRRTSLPCEFHGRIDHAELKGRHKIFLNPSITEVLCTTTAEALAMDSFIIIPHHPSNTFFEDFPNCLVYKNRMEFVTQLQYALAHDPVTLPPDCANKLSWEAATSRFISASITTQNRLGRTKADEKVVKFLRSALAGTKGDVIRTMIGGRDVGEQYQYTLQDRVVRALDVEVGKIRRNIKQQQHLCNRKYLIASISCLICYSNSGYGGRLGLAMSLEKYKLVSDTKADFDNVNVARLWSTREIWQKTNINELRITQKGKPKNYISDALQCFDQGSKKVILRAMGRAISKTVTVAEVLKRKLPSLHQVTHLSSFKVVDVYEPLEEGLDRVESIRYISCIEIMLSLDVDDVDIHDMGYQPPISPAQDLSAMSSDFNAKLDIKSPGHESN